MYLTFLFYILYSNSFIIKCKYKMESWNNQINVFPYPKEKIDSHPTIEFLLESFSPTFRARVTEAIWEKSRYIDYSQLSTGGLDNINHKSDIDNLENTKKLLIESLEKLSEISWGKAPIVFISDSCFTNDSFIFELKDLLGNDYNKFVKEITISYTDNSKNLNLSKGLYENSIVILWWSFSDLEDIPDSLFKSDLANFIKQVNNDKINSKLIWVCWGQQFVSSIIWFDEMFSEKIITTYRWVAQFWAMPISITNINQVPHIAKPIVRSITHNLENLRLSSIFTRTWHVDFNLFDTFQALSLYSSIAVIWVDPITKSPILWMTKNWNIIWNQAHFEIDINRDKKTLVDQIENLIPSLQKTYWNEVEKVLLNTKQEYQAKEKLWQLFYVPSLLTFANSIIAKHEFRTQNQEKEEIYKATPKEIQGKITQIISKENFDEHIDKSKLLEKLDQEWILEMLVSFDRKINRWLQEASNLVWFDFENFIKEHKEANKDTNYICRDLGSGNWTLVNDIEKLGVNIHGVSNQAYFDIYNSLIKLEQFSNWPRKNILKIFIEKLINKYKTLVSWSVKQRVIKAMEDINLTENDESFLVNSMFSEETYRFNDQERQKLDKQEIKFKNENPDFIQDIKDYIKNHFYEFISWNFDSTLFSDFSSLRINDKLIKKINLQLAIRSTCHIDSKDLENLLDTYVNIFAKPWSVFFDNWIVRSDSWVPRIQEYLDLEKNHKDIKVYFIYDPKTSYVTSAIILKQPYTDKKMIEKNLQSGYKLLESDEISKSSFFKIERIFRETMILCFKDLNFNHDKNKEISLFLEELSSESDSLSTQEIKQKIIEKINILIREINKELKEKYKKEAEKKYIWEYSEIDENVFDFYLEKMKPELKEFLSLWNVENPGWFNKNFKRK